MKKIITILTTVMPMILCGCQQVGKQTNPDKKVVAENDSIAVLYQVVDSAKDEYDIPEVEIWIRNKTTKQETKLLKTVRLNQRVWYVSDGNGFSPAPIDSIAVTNAKMLTSDSGRDPLSIYIYDDDPIQLILEGCPDLHNDFSYFIDVTTRKAWYVPTNGGYIGKTLVEGYKIFQSYRYVSDPDIAGRYTFLQLFDDEGNMIDSLDLEHLRLRRTE